MQIVSRDEFIGRAALAGCRALSANSRPALDEQARIYKCTLGQLISTLTYSAGGTDAARSCFLNYDSPDAHPIRIEELVTCPVLVNIRLSECASLADQPLSAADIVTLHCLGCDRRIVIDGIHRLVRLAHEKQYHASLTVTELAGAAWPINTPDFNLVCCCQRG